MSSVVDIKLMVICYNDDSCDDLIIYGNGIYIKLIMYAFSEDILIYTASYPDKLDIVCGNNMIHGIH